MQSPRTLITRKREKRLPIFLPVYQPKSNLISIEDIKTKYAIDGLIVNGFFLYKDAAVKKRLLTEVTLHEYIGFDGLIMTDSGAFQGLKRPLFLSNKKIVKFQDAIGADIISPLDLISPPGDSYPVAEKKLNSTIKRIKVAKQLTENSVLAGVQQGGRFLPLRQKSMDALMEMEVEYIAIGSLVPFFNKRHNMDFVCKVLVQAREIAGKDLPMHVYGAGDPSELPFLYALGADIFDSSSYGHYALDGWYMTYYGALKQEQKEQLDSYTCACRICKENKRDKIFHDSRLLAAHNLYCILQTIERLRKAIEEDSMTALLEDVLQQHEKWFADSLLVESWNNYHGG